MDTGTNDPEPQVIQPVLSPEELRKRRLTTAGIVVGVVIVLALFILGFIYLISPAYSSYETVARLRDISIILMAIESIVISLALVILIVQIARLTNLIENEVKPILDSTNETVSNLRGTTKFLSDNLVEPVIKLNEIVAVLQRLSDIFRLSGKK
ncbi:MAG: hypothetical protein C3F13_10055 [Anaerolineales bacterium]|nr:hypothetical protein [Anaerolineae bacterium]PWB52960.1 MAG: hypothetical protein C3F13_10055 [Anaerolineales bacterium]